MPARRHRLHGISTPVPPPGGASTLTPRPGVHGPCPVSPESAFSPLRTGADPPKLQARGGTHPSSRSEHEVFAPVNVHETGVSPSGQRGVPHRGRRARASRAKSKKDVVTGLI